ncbi:MAG: ASPIC/UnbV domain-containing [Planctomycetota bacterium]|nr:MAG: ASPIC/UnbV domain-containing [Planctomycetota bacterium]
MPPRSRKLFLPGLAILLVAVGAAIALVWKRQGPAEAPSGFVPRPKEFVTDIAKSEGLSDAVGKSVKSTFVKGLRERDSGLARKGMTADFRARFPRPAEGREHADGSLLIREYRDLVLQETDRDGFWTIIQAHMEGLTNIERTTWRPFTFLADLPESSAYCELHFQLAGPHSDGRRVDLSGSVRVQTVKEGEAWKVRRFEWIEGTRIEGRSGPWREITDAVGLHFNESDALVNLKQEVIDNRNNSAFGSLAVADFNRDGFWDVLASVNRQESVFFMNDGKGGFTRLPGPNSRRADTPVTWLAVDLDGDGIEEMVSSLINEYGKGVGWFDLYRRKGAEWERLQRAFEFPNSVEDRVITVQAIIPVDINRDGLLDLYFCGYSDNDSLKEDFNSLASFDGTPNYFFINQGNLKFTEEAHARGIVENQYTFTAKFFDFDFDGDLDLMDCNDYGPNVLWTNNGTGQFARTPGHTLEQGSNYTMGVSIADYDNNGTWAIHISNMYSHAGNRIVPLAAGISDELRETARVLAQGNQQYECDPSTRIWRECSVERCVNWADWAWGCNFADFDNDTDKDLFVTNGFTSHGDASKPDY